MTTPMTWLRPEFQGREDELIHLAAAADLAGVTRSAVSNWQRRHETFPGLALLTGSPDRPTKWVPRAEFEEFARAQREKPRGRTGPRGKIRTRAVIVQERVDRCARQVARLEAQEEERTAALRRTRAELRQAREQLLAARARIDEERAAFEALASSSSR
ncbi:hypothetical protein [Streptomyces sp. NPDC096153]|uniref:hypothetical protein n=1 Tax=Streptomyces sp. NPDC096153 TaxID=3155548 RepID=UPI003321A5BA